MKPAASIREALLGKGGRTAFKGALSTGSTLLNLASTDTPGMGFAKGRYYYLVGDSTSGKAQPLDALVLTKKGWVSMASVQLGDRLVDPDGGDAFVTGVFPQGLLEVFLMKLSDGGSVEVSGDHLWVVQRPSERAANKTSVRTTLELKSLLEEPNRATWRHYLPIASPTVFEGAPPLPVDPYVLGCLIGDGCFDRPVRFSCYEQEILEEFRKRLPEDVVLSHRERGDYDVIRVVGESNRVSSLLQAVRDLGLDFKRSHNKFIPVSYLRGSIDDRWLLLQGLMDTDGYVCSANGVSYSTASSQLANDVAELVRSLGGVASISLSKNVRYRYKGELRKGKDSYSVSIRLPNRKEVFRLQRKKDRVTSDGFVNRSIVSIESVGFKECQCISVSSRRHLYVTNDYVVTHNTWLSMTCLAEAAINKDFDDYRFIFDDVEGGAQMDIEYYFGKAVAARMEPPSYKGKTPVYSDTVESFYFHVDDAIKGDRPFIYILDSQDSLVSRASKKKFGEHKKASEEGDEMVGSYGDGKAKYHSENLRHIIAGLKKTGSILIIIGQTRDNMGFGFEKKTRSGGKALRFYATTEIWTSVLGKLKKMVRGRERTVGALCLAEVKKNRFTGKVGKDRAVTIPIYYNLGIDDVGSCVDYLIAEKHWKKTEKIIDADDILFEGSRNQVVAYIEEEGLEDKVRKIVAEVWKTVEQECSPERKRRYS